MLKRLYRRADIPGKPATYPADAHAHSISEVTGLQATLEAISGGAGMVGFTLGGTTANGTADVLTVPVTSATAGTYKVCYQSTAVGGSYMEVDTAHTLRVVS